MTDEMMTLRSLVETAPDADLLRDMIGFNGRLRHHAAAVAGPRSRNTFTRAIMAPQARDAGRRA